MTCSKHDTPWKVSPLITPRCVVPDEDKERIRELHHAIELAQQSGDLDAESNAVLQYQIAVTEAAHNVVLLHLLRCMEPMLAQNVRQNFELLYSRREMLPLVSSHRTRIFEAIMAGKPEEARGSIASPSGLYRRNFARQKP
ncbi:Transcriptional regulator protein [Escherichia coli]|uniref:Transcriptional regulator protein n=1 Tax=Escherichia coli TaxID=562 RepID=A0A376VYN3_ECOLX|nr:Transcriptional regulator protein [Escherichia coli]